MMTVRFPNGFSIQYNTATYSKPDAELGITRLYTKKDNGDLVAYAPLHGCVIEWIAPCRTYNCVRDETTETVRALMQSEFKTIQRQIRALGKKAKP